MISFNALRRGKSRLALADAVRGRTNMHASRHRCPGAQSHMQVTCCCNLVGLPQCAWSVKQSLYRVQCMSLSQGTEVT